MSNQKLIDRITDADPLKDDPQAPPIEALLSRLDQRTRAFGEPLEPPRKRTLPTFRFRTVTALAVAAACALAVFIALGSTRGGTSSVLADVYRALTPGSGVVHMVEVTERSAGGTTTTTREEIWTAQNPRRLHSVTTTSEGKTYEWAFSSSPLENRRWSEEEPGVIFHSTPTGALTSEATPVTLLRELVEKGEMTLAGQTTLEGRAVWRLDVHPVNYTEPIFHGTQLPNPTMYVDASTFAPVELVAQSLTHAGGQSSGAPEVLTEKTRYTTYEESPKDAQSASALSLAEHPGAVEKTEP